ncbi:MAG: hypothetical protein N3B11_04955, partial [Coriobacteriia bacterium]|nr:hypothetical protein [Coriobacteriia bacterium]
MRTENPPAGGASDARAARDRLSAARFAAAAAVLAIVGAVAIASMPAPRAPVPSAPGSSGALQLYYESGFPTPGEEPLERPVGVAVMADRVYVADSVAGVVRIFDERGVPRSIVGSGTLSVPTYVACDAARRQVFVTDRKAKALFVFDADGSSLRRLEVTGAPAPAGRSAEATSWEPLGVAAGEDGSIFVTDVSGRHALLLLDASGRVRRAVGGAGDDAPVVVALEYPNDVAIVGPEVWLSDSNNGRVLVFDDAGAYLRAITVRGVVRGLAAIPGTDAAPAAVAGVDALAHDIVVWDLRG